MLPLCAIIILYTLFEQISPNLLSSPSSPSVVKSLRRNSFSCTFQLIRTCKISLLPVNIKIDVPSFSFLYLGFFFFFSMIKLHNVWELSPPQINTPFPTPQEKKRWLNSRPFPSEGGEISLGYNIMICHPTLGF